MRSVIKNLAVLMVVILSLFLLSACGGGGGSDSGSVSTVADTYSPATVGYSWNYRALGAAPGSWTQTYTVTSSNSSGFTIKTKSSGSSYYENQTNYIYDGSSLKITDRYGLSSDGSVNSHTQYTPPGIVLPSNMTSNATGSTTSIRTVTAGGFVDTDNTTRSVTVNGEESVTTPAGTFTATKVTLTETKVSPGGTSIQDIYTEWYVKNIGRVKSSVYFLSIPDGTPLTDTIELITYGQTPPIDTTGIWRGTYISSLFGSNTATLGLVQTGSTITGNFSSTTGALGNVSGSVSGDTAHYTITVTTPGCSGSFTGTGIVDVPLSGHPTMGFNYSGSSTCGGAESGTGNLTLQ